MRYTLFATIWIVIIVAYKDNYAIPSICAGVHFLGLIGQELEIMTKQRKESSDELLRTIESSIMDLINKK